MLVWYCYTFNDLVYYTDTYNTLTFNCDSIKKPFLNKEVLPLKYSGILRM